MNRRGDVVVVILTTSVRRRSHMPADRAERGPAARHHAASERVYWYLDASRAERELGFAPRDPMDTLVDTVEELRG
jgi:hypothetical protein